MTLFGLLAKSSDQRCLAIPRRFSCPHLLLLATRASSSHSSQRCHDLLFLPTLSPGRHPGPVHCWPFTFPFNGQEDISCLGAYLRQKKRIVASGVIISDLALLAPHLHSLNEERAIQERSNSLLASNDFLTSPSCT